jgi:hypothetical protein
VDTSTKCDVRRSFSVKNLGILIFYTDQSLGGEPNENLFPRLLQINIEFCALDKDAYKIVNSYFVFLFVSVEERKRRTEILQSKSN